MKYKKIFLVVLILTVLIIALDQYGKHELEIKIFLRFNENNIIGYSKSDIIKEYGEFDRVFICERKLDSKIAKYSGLYKVLEEVDFWGPNVNVYYWILFSGDDIAIATDIGTPIDEY